MKKAQTLLLLTMLSTIALCQVNPQMGGVLAQQYSKEITEYKVKEFIYRNILQLSDKQGEEVEIDAITASVSGELTTVVYNCSQLKKSGLILGFWDLQHGYAFKNMEYDKAKEFLSEVENVLETKKAYLNMDESNISIKNYVYRFDDLILSFNRGSLGANLIRVFWNGFDSDWNQSNFKTMRKRFDKFFSGTKK